MAWKCQQCGHENDGSGNTCQGCGTVRPGNVVLVSEATGKKASMRINTDVGKYLFRSLVGDDAKYASDPQFHLMCDRATGVWTIQHDGKARNPTFLDGTQLPGEPTALSDGGVVTIGADKARLTVKMEYGG